MKILKFESDNCPACEQIESRVKRVCDTLNIEVEKIDVRSETGMDRAQKLKVWGIPTLLLVRENDEVIANIRNVCSDDELYHDIVENLI